MQIEKLPTPLAEFVSDTFAIMKVRADAKNHSLHYEIMTATPRVILTDPTRLRQILINLIGNALKYTDSGGIRLCVRCTESIPRSLQSDVIDTGIGMTAEQIARLFIPFSQADSSMSRRFGGTGVGLAISKRLAEMFSGELAVVDSDPGVGTRFRLTIDPGSIDGAVLPAEVAAPAHAITSSTDSHDHKHVARLLYVEDGLDDQVLVSLSLKKWGALVTVADDGQKALKCVAFAQSACQPFDIVLMDMQVPIMDGYQATSELRRTGYDRSIIALTAHAMSGDREKCLAAGCDDYLTKPINRELLIETVSEWMTKVPVTA